MERSQVIFCISLIIGTGSYVNNVPGINFLLLQSKSGERVMRENKLLIILN